MKMAALETDLQSPCLQALIGTTVIAEAAAAAVGFLLQKRRQMKDVMKDGGCQQWCGDPLEKGVQCPAALRGSLSAFLRS
jgi:hypothetical protein